MSDSVAARQLCRNESNEKWKMAKMSCRLTKNRRLIEINSMQVNKSISKIQAPNEDWWRQKRNPKSMFRFCSTSPFFFFFGEIKVNFAKRKNKRRRKQQKSAREAEIGVIIVLSIIIYRHKRRTFAFRCVMTSIEDFILIFCCHSKTTKWKQGKSVENFIYCKIINQIRSDTVKYRLADESSVEQCSMMWNVLSSRRRKQNAMKVERTNWNRRVWCGTAFSIA